MSDYDDLVARVEFLESELAICERVSQASAAAHMHEARMRRELEAKFAGVEWVQGRWWRVERDGHIWCETSVMEEAVDAYNRIDPKNFDRRLYSSSRAEGHRWNLERSGNDS